MCLNSHKLKLYDGTSEEWILAYKIFIRDNTDPNILWSPYFTESYKVLQLAEAVSIPVRSDGKIEAQIYESGFHAFLTEKAALRYLRDCMSWAAVRRFKLKSVLIRKLTAKGIQHKRTCVVGKEMIVLP